MTNSALALCGTVTGLLADGQFRSPGMWISARHQAGGYCLQRSFGPGLCPILRSLLS